MSADKREIIKDLKFCKELMDRLLVYASKPHDNGWQNGSSVIRADIRRLRRELNDVSHKTEWNYGE